LTAAAALLSALTGLIIAFDQLGLGRDDDTAATTTAGTPTGETARSEPVTTAPLPAAGAAAYRASLPDGATATIGELVYEILETRVERANPGELALDLLVRMRNNQDYDANFWDATFRLLVDGVPRAPNSGLNEVVAGRSADEGTVSFVVPESAADLVLLVGADDPVRLRIAIVEE
jgi:hypothetical protein